MSHELVPILGGTFDPVHNGHLRCALEIARWTDAPVRLLPSRLPAHRAHPAATAPQRLDMLRRAVEGHADLIVDDRELDRPGPTYSVDTLSAWREAEPESAFCFILGYDAFGGLPEWKDWRRLPALTHFVVVTRPGESPSLPEELEAWSVKARAEELEVLRNRPAGRIIFHAVTPLAISASRIRRDVAAGMDPAFLVPEAVREYILSNDLYKKAN